MRTLLVIISAALFVTVVSGDLVVPPGFKATELTGQDGQAERGNINDRGQVVYQAREDYLSIPQVYLYHHGVTTQLSDGDFASGNPDINNEGAIVWMAAIGPDNGDWDTSEIMLYKDGNLTRLTDNDVDDSGPIINARGDVLWTRYAKDDITVMLYKDGEITDLTPRTTSDWAVALNDNGDVVINRRITHQDKSWNQALYLLRDGVETPISPEGGDARFIVGMDNSGNIWWSEPTREGDIMWHWKEGENFQVIQPAAAYGGANERGDVAFYRFYGPKNEDHWFEAWMIHNGEFIQLSTDRRVFWNWVEDINQRGEFVFFTGDLYDHQLFVVERAGRRGDLDCNDNVDFNDIDAFVVALLGLDTYFGLYPDCDAWYGDMNENGRVDMDDIDGFVHALIDG